MGIFNSFGAVSGQMSAKQERVQIANALIEELKVPGKLAEILKSLDTNGQGNLIRQWISGEAKQVDATQLQQGLRPSTLLDDLATKTRMPIGVVKAGLAILLPLSIEQLARDGYVTAEGEASGKQLIQLDDLANALR